MSNSSLAVIFPQPLHHQIGKSAVQDVPSATDSFNVSAQGTGSFTGLAYTVPAHTKGHLEAEIETLALTSEDVKNLNDLIKSMVSASDWQKVTDYEATHASANLSVFSLFSSGGSASYDKTHESMSGYGLSEDDIKTVIAAMAKAATNMSKVKIDFEIDNSSNDYSVSGSLLLYTIAGTITTGNTQTQYRLLADSGSAGQNGATAPATGVIIPLK